MTTMLHLTTEEWSSIEDNLTVLTKVYDENAYINQIVYGFGPEIKEELIDDCIMDTHELFLATLCEGHLLAVQDQQFLIAKKIIEVAYFQTKLVENILMLEQDADYLADNIQWLYSIREYLAMTFQDNVTKKIHK